jgi:alkylation response protein AidB-like acyl-CoA dehydrogenase
MATNAVAAPADLLRTLPGDDVRQILWRLTDRFDLQMLVQSVRAVARGPVARLVAAGGRNTHEWTPEKNAILKEYDACGLTALFMDPEDGGYIEGPKNLALALAAFELAWVDAGAATGSLATCLALAPIHERGTEEQRRLYKSRCVPQPGIEPWRGAFALTEPIPYVGVETGLLSGRVTVAEWNPGEEPVLEVTKRGRFITNMGFANFVTAAVDSGDDRLKGSCMVILEESDPGTWDRGTPTKKLVHQLSSTNDPVFQLRVPASRIIGGYTVKDGVIVPRYSHGEVIEAVFKRTRVTVGLMTAAKLLSAVEPLIRYHRDRFRGGESVAPGSPRYEFGLQQREDVLHRLLEVWATGEAAASLGFAAARCFDALDPLEKVKDKLLAERGVHGGTAAFKALRNVAKDAVEFLTLAPGSDRYNKIAADPLVQFVVLDAEANVLCPATKLWNTGHGANVMREAVSLMGGYGITEDCPGFLGRSGWTLSWKPHTRDRRRSSGASSASP